jgi:hypothetical protein
MNNSLIERVRTSCMAVSEQSTYVRIDAGGVDAYAAALPREQLSQPEHDAGAHYLGHGDDTAAYFVTLDAINFGSGYFPHLRKRAGMSGYFTVASRLNDHYREHGPLSALQLSQLTPADCTWIFQQDPDDATVRELMQWFARALNDLGQYLLSSFGASFANLIRAANGSATRLVELLVQMPLFRDVESYKGFDVAFYKRAQLTAADLAISFHNEGLGRFTDLDQLTIFADNLVPHVLRMDGILLYDEALAARIDAEELIPAGSPEEVEIRACALHAVELMAQSLHTAGHPITPMQLDYLLWNRGQQPFYKKTRPRHRTRTTFY